MQKKIGLSIILIKFVLLALIITPIISGDEIPVLPHQFYGYVFDENGNLIRNGNVTAKLGSKIFTTPIKNGTYGYPAITEGFPINGTNGDVGKIIYFYINNTITSNTAIFQAGGINDNYSHYFNLSLDVIPPIISSVSVSSITSSQAKISWMTNEKSNSTVNYGTTKQLGNKKEDTSFVKNHEIIINNLQSNTIYYFEVISYDIAGNTAVDNNFSNYYSFKTNEESQNGGNNDETSGGNPSSPPFPGENEENIPPIANPGGPYYKKVNQTVIFDASGSRDPDGYIVEYSWNFGDGITQKTTNITVTHKYSKSDSYIVSLTVTDNKGATNTTTTIVYISEEDTDGDGWSDEAEEYYHTDPNNASSFPIDTDGDSIPDSLDSDDDNDGLTDIEEKNIGTNSTNKNDVLRVISEFGLFYLVDIDNNNVYDKYYNQSSAFLSNLYQKSNTLFLIDVNNDSVYDYLYNTLSGEIEEYSEEFKEERSALPLYFGIIILIALLIIVIIIFLNKRRKKIS